MASGDSVQPMTSVRGTDPRSQVYKKVTRRILPLVMLCYFLAYLDRGNIGIAKLRMNEDVGLSAAAFGFGSGLFFIGYLLFEVPSNIGLHRFGAKKTISRIMVLWGLCATCTMFVQTPLQFYTVRFLLGVFEAGFFPGIILYLTYWFPAKRRARAIGMFMVAIPVSGLIGSPIGGWMLRSLDGLGGLAGWRWLFLIEGFPSVIVGVAVVWLLTDTPAKAKWLSDREKEIISQDLAEDSRLKSGVVPHTLKELLTSPLVVLLVVVVFVQAMGQYGVSFWLPSLVKGAGVHGTLAVGLVTAAPFACGVVAMVLVSRSSDRMRERRWHLSIPFCVTAAGLSASAALGGEHVILGIICLCVGAAGAYTVSAVCWNLPPALLAGIASAAGIAAINSIGGLGGFVSPYLIGLSKTLTGGTAVGLYILSGVLVLFGAVLTHRIPADRVNR